MILSTGLHFSLLPVQSNNATAYRGGSLFSELSSSPHHMRSSVSHPKTIFSKKFVRENPPKISYQ